MKRYLIISAICLVHFIFLTIVIYGLQAFIRADFDFRNWTEIQRSLTAFLEFVAIVLTVVVFVHLDQRTSRE